VIKKRRERGGHSPRWAAEPEIIIIIIIIIMDLYRCSSYFSGSSVGIATDYGLDGTGIECLEILGVSTS
jgi:hypothetical protein